MTDSSTGGYLTPAQSPLEGRALANFLQAWIVGCSNLPGDMVRPAWQSEPPNIPDSGTAWASFAIKDRDSDVYPYVAHSGAGDGSDTLQRHETLTIVVSFYDLGIDGQADMFAAQFRDGTAIAQNRESLTLAGMGFVRASRAITAPSLLKTRWLNRVDIEVVIRRQIVRTYKVLNLESAAGDIYTDVGLPPQPF